MAENDEKLISEIRKQFNAIYEMEDLAERVSRLEKRTKELESERPKLEGINGYRYTPEEIGKLIGIDSNRLKELAEAGYAPCRINNESGEIYFKRAEIFSWIKKNFFHDSNGKDLPQKIFVYSDSQEEIDSVIPKEISDIEGLGEFKTINFPPCVYFLVKNKKVVYVGKSEFLPGRVHQHQIEKEYDRVFYLSMPKSDLDRIERDFIKALNPPLNRAK